MSSPWIEPGILCALLNLFPAQRREGMRRTLLEDVERYGSATVEAALQYDGGAFQTASHALSGVLGNIGAQRLGRVVAEFKARDEEGRARDAGALREGLEATLQALRDAPP